MSWNRTKFPLVVSLILLSGLILLAAVIPGADSQAGAAVAQDNAKNGVKLVGVIKFDGPAPKRTPIVMIGNKANRIGGSADECRRLHKKPVLSESAIVSKEGEVANAFVYVKKGLEKGKEYPMPKEPVVLNQSKCMFSPRVQGIRVGQELVIRNADKLTHNTRSYALRNRPFNIAQKADAPERTKSFRKPERAILIGCDIHRWMQAYLFALDHPFFAVTDEKGQFRIEGLPVGEYTLAAWHEQFGEQEAKITVGSSGSIETNFTFKPKKKA